MTISVNDLHVHYLVGNFLHIGLKDYVLRKLNGTYKVRELKAVNGVSFTLEHGDFLGIIGINGAGKSTLLKAIAGIMQPTSGEITINGKVVAILELGAGFDNELTVRENTYLRGALLGYTKAFMNEKYTEIIAFAELEEFEDYVFSKLSSGMKSRLAFSVSCFVQPEILILDEILSVGDTAFKQKSDAKMREIISSGVTTLYVSHSLEQTRSMCNKVLWLDKGKQMAFGDCDEVCDMYMEFLGNK